MEQPIKVQVLFSDTALLVINKPAGLSTLPDGYDPSLPHIKSVLEQSYGRLWIVHRLDKETSGVLLLARSAQAHRLLNTQFEQHQVHKIYHALVIGNPEWQEKTIELPLRSNGDRHHRTVVDPQSGKPAITHFKVLERFIGCYLMQAAPETGRTHQIRAHLSSMGLLILGDMLYSRGLKPIQPLDKLPMIDNGARFIGPGRMCLHARILEFNHPLTSEHMKFSAEYPSDYESMLKQLRHTCSNLA